MVIDLQLGLAILGMLLPRHLDVSVCRVHLIQGHLATDTERTT